MLEKMISPASHDDQVGFMIDIVDMVDMVDIYDDQVGFIYGRYMIYYDISIWVNYHISPT
jgi:hypothetical protein